MQQDLKNLFLDKSLEDAYLILDDVKSHDVLKIFQTVRAKLIVTTQDRKVADNTAEFIKVGMECLKFVLFFVYFQVEKGFTEKETLEMLKKSLNTTDILLNEAHLLHEVCEGFPMLLNIVGSILNDSREEALVSSDIWNSIIHEIKEHNYIDE